MGRSPISSGLGFACPVGYAFKGYSGTVYPPGAVSTPAPTIRPDRCFRSEAEARDAGYILPRVDAHVLAGTQVLYGIGVSTDPYGNSSPAGVGIATADGQGALTKVEAQSDGLGLETRWIGSSQFVAERPGGSWAIYRIAGSRLEEVGLAPLPAPFVWDFAWSPDGSMIAFEPARLSRSRNGYFPGEQVIVEVSDGSRQREVVQGSLAGWAPDGRILYWPRSESKPVGSGHSGELVALDLATGRTEPLISDQMVAEFSRRPGPIGLGDPVFSADGSYLAMSASVVWRKGDANLFTVLIARADGTPIRFITSPYAISMFAWSPVGHRLAYTTSGFPAPHQLLVLDEPGASPREVFETEEHFDWVTWSPDGLRLLLDAEHFQTTGGAWLVLDAKGGPAIETLPRLGGAPLWCWPAEPFGSGA